MSHLAGRERFVLVYDFVDDRQRTKLAKILEEYGIRIQYSVFEFELSPAKKKELFGKLKRRGFLDDEEGQSVIVIPIDGHTLEQIERYGDATGFFDAPSIVSI